MAGLFDNETRRYLYDDGLFYGDWYVDEDGFLFIIPLDEQEIDSPDGEILDRLNAICREYDVVLDEEAEELGLNRVACNLKRFSEEDGYYYA